MRITRLVLEDFRSYSYADIEFGGLSSVVLVGKNGDGKSALLDAILWALYGVTRSKTDDQFVRHGTDLARVRVEFLVGEESYVVVREKPRNGTSTLGFWTSNEDEPTRKLRQHAIKETTAKIERTIGLSYEGLTAGPIMIQKNAAPPTFMKALPSKRKDLLADLLDLAVFPPLYEAAKSRRSEVAGKYGALNARRDQLVAQIATYEGGVVTLPASQERLAAASEAQSLASTRIETLRVQLAAVNERVRRHSALEAREQEIVNDLRSQGNEKARLGALIDGRLGELSIPEPNLTVLPAPDPGVTARLEAELAEAQRAGRDAAALGQQHHAAEVALVSARENTDRLARVPCHGVGIYADCIFLTSAKGVDLVAAEARVTSLKGKWQTAAAAAGLSAQIERDLSKERTSLQESTVSRSKAENAHTRWTDGLASARSAIEEAERSLSAVRDRTVALVAEQDRVVAEKVAIEADFVLIRKIEADAADAHTAYASAKMEADRAADVVREGERISALLTAGRDEQARVVAQLADSEVEGKTFRTLMDAFHRDGIPTRIIEGSIPLIEGRANEVLASMPNDFVVQLVTQRANKTGGMADTLDIVVTKNGWAMDYEDLSSAQQFRVDFALRMGISRMLTHRTGRRIETLWLDEPDADLDEEGREALLECLAAVEDEFALIVVASHHPFLTDRFPSRIEATMVDDMSTAEVVA